MLFSNKDLKNLMIPLILEQLLVVSVGMIDTMMISSVGEAAVSGVSLVDMVVKLIMNVLAALATGGAVVTSQLIGAKKREEANTSAQQLLYISFLSALLVSIIVAVFHKGILNLLFGKIEQDVMKNAITYLLICILSFPALGIYNGCAALFRSMGNSQITLRVSVIMNIINVIGNAICIMVLHMGVAGVAIPTLISRVVAAAMLYIAIKKPKNMIRLPKFRLYLDRKMIRKIFYIGIPSGIENGIFELGRVLVVSIIAGFGTVQIAANGVANSLDSLGCIIGQATSLAMIVVIGRCVGARDEVQIKYYTKKIMIFTYISTAICNTIMLASLPWILSLYGLGKETTDLAYLLVMIHNGMAIFLWPVAFVFPNMLRACNDAKFTMQVSVFSMCVFRLVLSYVLGARMGFGAIGVWCAMIVDWIFRVIVFIARYASGKWKRDIQLIE